MQTNKGLQITNKNKFLFQKEKTKELRDSPRDSEEIVKR
jgi:hypothetical protein